MAWNTEVQSGTLTIHYGDETVVVDIRDEPAKYAKAKVRAEELLKLIGSHRFDAVITDAMSTTRIDQ